MADYPSPGRLAIQQELADLTVQKATNEAQIIQLQLQNDQIDIAIGQGEDTLAYIESQTAPTGISGMNVTLDGSDHPVIVYDDNGAGYSYQIQRSYIGDFSDASDLYTGVYNSGIVDAFVTLTSGQTMYYRIKNMKMGQDDSDWVEDSVTKP